MAAKRPVEPMKARAEAAPRVARHPFREIAQEVKGIDNRRLTLKSVRVGIRLLARVAGFAAAAPVLRAARRVIPAGEGKQAAYLRHLLLINSLRMDYIRLFAAGDMRGAVEKKIDWAVAVLNESRSLRARWDARQYLALLARHGYAPSEFARPCTAVPDVASERRFYIYGPNAEDPPSLAYADHTIVLPKPIEVDTTRFADSILFLNSIYYRTVVEREPELRSSLTRRYGEVFVSCRESVLEPPFRRSKFPMGDSIASAMGLGRILFNLLREHGSFRCVIAGFDLYLKPSPYGAYYPTLARMESGALSEYISCQSLADHDALYNFLFVKEIAGRLEIVDSPEFLSIMALSGWEYLEELKRARSLAMLGRP